MKHLLSWKAQNETQQQTYIISHDRSLCELETGPGWTFWERGEAGHNPNRGMAGTEHEIGTGSGPRFGFLRR